MAKLSKEKRGMLLNIGFIVLTLLLMLYLVSKAGDPQLILTAFTTINPWWLAGAVGCFATHVLLEGLILRVFFYFQKVPITWGSCNLVGLIGMYYSSITPAATGGQPMQAFAFKKRGVPSGIGYSSLAVKFFCWQCALLLIGAALWILKGSYIHMLLGRGVWLVALGFFFNSLMVSIVILLAINRNLVRAIIIFVNLGYRLRLIKNRERTSSRLDAALTDFHSSVEILTKSPSSFGAVYDFHGAGDRADERAVLYLPRVLTDQPQLCAGAGSPVLLYITASFTPLPGASGAQEGGFYLFFRNFFPDASLFAALLIWRFVTYYLFIIVGFFAVFIDQTLTLRRNRKKRLAEEALAVLEEPIE